MLLSNLLMLYKPRIHPESLDAKQRGVLWSLGYIRPNIYSNIYIVNSVTCKFSSEWHSFLLPWNTMFLGGGMHVLMLSSSHFHVIISLWPCMHSSHLNASFDKHAYWTRCETYIYIYKRLVSFVLLSPFPLLQSLRSCVEIKTTEWCNHLGI